MLETQIDTTGLPRPYLWKKLAKDHIIYQKAFWGTKKSYLVWYGQQWPGVAQVIHTHQTSCYCSCWPRRFTLYCSHSWIFTFILEGSSPLCTRVYTKPIWWPTCDAPLSRLITLFRSTTEIVLPQPHMCVNRGPNRYDFHGGAKAIHYSVNIALKY